MNVSDGIICVTDKRRDSFVLGVTPDEIGSRSMNYIDVMSNGFKLSEKFTILNRFLYNTEKIGSTQNVVTYLVSCLLFCILCGFLCTFVLKLREKISSISNLSNNLLNYFINKYCLIICISYLMALCIHTLTIRFMKKNITNQNILIKVLMAHRALYLSLLSLKINMIYSLICYIFKTEVIERGTDMICKTVLGILIQLPIDDSTKVIPLIVISAIFYDFPVTNNISLNITDNLQTMDTSNKIRNPLMRIFLLLGLILISQLHYTLKILSQETFEITYIVVSIIALIILYSLGLLENYIVFYTCVYCVFMIFHRSLKVNMVLLLTYCLLQLLYFVISRSGLMNLIRMFNSFVYKEFDPLPTTKKISLLFFDILFLLLLRWYHFKKSEESFNYNRAIQSDDKLGFWFHFRNIPHKLFILLFHQLEANKVMLAVYFLLIFAIKAVIINKIFKQDVIDSVLIGLLISLICHIAPLDKFEALLLIAAILGISVFVAKNLNKFLSQELLIMIEIKLCDGIYNIIRYLIIGMVIWAFWIGSMSSIRIEFINDKDRKCSSINPIKCDDEFVICSFYLRFNCVAAFDATHQPNECKTIVENSNIFYRMSDLYKLIYDSPVGSSPSGTDGFYFYQLMDGEFNKTISNPDMIESYKDSKCHPHEACDCIAKQYKFFEVRNYYTLRESRGNQNDIEITAYKANGKIKYTINNEEYECELNAAILDYISRNLH